MDIGTAKPDRRDARARAASPDRHHRPDRGVFGRALPRRRARRDRGHPRARARAARRRRDDALLQGAARRPERASRRRSGDARARSTRAPRREGWPALHAELARVDPATAARLAADRRAAHPARARGARAHRHAALAAAGHARSRRRARADRSRSRSCPPTAPRLHAAIAERFDAMLDAGLVDEVAALARAVRAHARPAVDALRRLPAGVGRFSTARSTPRRFARKGIAATRQLAKRQLTWLRATPATAFDPRCAGARRCSRRVARARGRGCASVARDARPVALTAPRMR